jgi:hypothetical protein
VFHDRKGQEDRKDIGDIELFEIIMALVFWACLLNLASL